MKSKHQCLHSLKEIDFSSEPSSELQTNWTACPLGRKSIEIQTNTTSLLNYYSNKVLPLQFELAHVDDVSVKTFNFLQYHFIDL